MAMDSSISAEDQSGRKVFSEFQAVQNFYVNAAASEAIDYPRRHIRVKQGDCDHFRKDQSD
jgi:hypothetical protein